MIPVWINSVSGGVVMSLFRTEEADPTEWGEDEEEDPEAESDEDIFDEED